MALPAFDLVGGATANPHNSCKRFYHTSCQRRAISFRISEASPGFTLLHLRPVLVVAAFDRGYFFFGAFCYGLLLLRAAVILKTPVYLQPPAEFLLISMALLLNLDVIPPIAGFEWLTPALFLKILCGHLGARAALLACPSPPIRIAHPAPQPPVASF